MLSRRTLRTLLAGAALSATSLVGLAGCGGLGVGDYRFYRVALDETVADASCYADNTIPDDIKDDFSTLRGTGTFILYVAGDEEPLLDTGDLVLGGAATDTGYSFSGDDVDISYPPGTSFVDSDHDGIDDQNDPMVDADNDGLDDKTSDPDVDVDMDGLDDRFQDNLVDANMDGIDDNIVNVPSGTKFIKSSTITITMDIDGSAATGTVKVVTEQKCEGNNCPMDYAKSCTRTTAYKGIEVDDATVDIKSSSSSNTP